MNKRFVMVGVGVAVVVAAVVVTRGGGGDGGCLSGLADHVPEDLDLVAGSDLGRARDAGLDFGSTEEAVDATRATDVLLDSMSQQRLQSLGEASTSTGYEIDDVDCWVGYPAGGAFVAEGSFDRDAVTSSELGRENAAVGNDLLTYDPDGDPGRMAAEEGAHPLVALVASFDERDAISFVGQAVGPEDEPVAIGLGLADGAGDAWDLLVVWRFADDDAAENGVGRALDAVNEGDVAAMIEGDPEERLHRDGSTVWLRAPLADEANRWIRPMTVFDPVFSAFYDTSDDNDETDEAGG